MSTCLCTSSLNPAKEAISLAGKIIIPPSKSHSIRAILFAAMADGRSYLQGLLNSPDIQAALRAAKALGANVEMQSIEEAGQEYITATLEGVAGKPQLKSAHLDVGNSGQVLRFFGALAALASQPIVLTGDASVSSQRTMQPLLDALLQCGVKAFSLNGNGLAPVYIQGPLQPGSSTLCGMDSQPVSAMLIAASFLPGTSQICSYNSGELPWIALTLSWLARLGVPYEEQVSDCSSFGSSELFEDVRKYTVQGISKIPPFSYTPPADFSSAAFPAIAALITGSTITLEGLDFNDMQGDRLLFTQLKQMGALIEEKGQREMQIGPGRELKGAVIDLDKMIDALPILAVLGCFAEGKTELVGALSARGKECDRIAVMAESLSRFGAKVEEKKEGLVIYQSKLKAPLKPFSSFGDHRIAMALAIAALAAEGETVIEETQCIKKSYPTFCRDMAALGAPFQEDLHGVLRVGGK